MNAKLVHPDRRSFTHDLMREQEREEETTNWQVCQAWKGKVAASEDGDPTPSQQHSDHKKPATTGTFDCCAKVEVPQLDEKDIWTLCKMLALIQDVTCANEGHGIERWRVENSTSNGRTGKPCSKTPFKFALPYFRLQ